MDVEELHQHTLLCSLFRSRSFAGSILMAVPSHASLVSFQAAGLRCSALNCTGHRPRSLGCGFGSLWIQSDLRLSTRVLRGCWVEDAGVVPSSKHSNLCLPSALYGGCSPKHAVQLCHKEGLRTASDCYLPGWATDLGPDSYYYVSLPGQTLMSVKTPQPAAWEESV